MLMTLLQVMEIVVLVATGGYIGYQTQGHFSLTRSQHYIERFNSGEMRKLRTRVNNWIERGQPLDKIFPEKPPLDDESQLDLEALRLFSNFFQELGTAYKYRTVSRAYIWDVFGQIILRYGEDLAAFISEYRIHVNRKGLYIDFECLIEDIQKMDKKKQKAMRNTTWFSDHRHDKND
ncbi:MAG: hypothetical protein COA73_06530 [Candidatus Hydrogenedentota bacterium]|nr:MAG: hypothetical protein COA73_06530 [Candidatus Hydrogenedentota bacterium]